MLTHPKPTVGVLCKLTQFIRQVALLRAEFEPPKLSFQSDLRRRAASRWALPHISSNHYKETALDEIVYCSCRHKSTFFFVEMLLVRMQIVKAGHSR